MNRLERVYGARHVSVRDVGLRDGIQMLSTFPTTEQKKHWIQAEYDAGVRLFEVGSFLPETRFPQFADISEIISFTRSLPGAAAVGLALNERGIQDGLNAGADELTVVLSATEEHNQANARRSREDSLAAIRNAVEMRNSTNPNTIINVGISMAFGCSIAGSVNPDEVLRMVERSMESGADTVGIADTVGYAGPREISAVCERVTKLLGDTPYLIHLHNTRGTGIANAAAALDSGARIFDASLAGLGGCPFAPGATGNVVLEDLVFLLEKMGVDTGVDIEMLVKARDIIALSLPDEPLHGALASAGIPKNFVYSREVSLQK